MENAILDFFKKSGNKVTLTKYLIFMGKYFFIIVRENYSLFQKIRYDDDAKSQFKNLLGSSAYSLFIKFKKHITDNYDALVNKSEEQLDNSFASLVNPTFIKYNEIDKNIGKYIPENIQVEKTKNRISLVIPKAQNDRKKPEPIKKENTKGSSTPVSHQQQSQLPPDMINDCNALLVNIKEKRNGSIVYPFWKNLITPAEYTQLKKLIDNRKHIRILIDEYPLLVGLYVSEWYKRECNGMNAEFNLLENGGLSANLFKKLENIQLDGKEFLKRHGNQNISWLQSLFIQGGLPIKWFSNSEKETDLAALWEHVINGNELTTNISNSIAYTDSMRDGSLREFIEYFRDFKPVFSEEDQNNHMFKVFSDTLRNIAWKDSKKKKFKNEIIARIIDGEINFTTRISLKKAGNLEVGNYISYQRLDTWNIKPQYKEFAYFELSATGNPKYNNIIFYNDFNSHFFAKKDFFDIDMHVCKKHEISIGYPDGSNDDISDLFDIPSFENEGHIQLYFNGTYWSDQKRKGTSILVFDPQRWQLNAEYEGNVELVTWDNTKVYNKVYIYTQINLTDMKGNSRTFRRDYDKIELIPKLFEFINYQDNYKFHSDYDEDLPVLFKSQDNKVTTFEVYKTRNDNTEKVASEDFRINLDDIKTTCVKELTIDLPTDEISLKRKFLVIPFKGQEPVKSDSINHTIQLNFPVTNHTAGEIIHIEDKYDTDNCSFEIQVGESTYQIDIFLPYVSKDLVFDNTVVTQEISIIPKQSAERMMIRKRNSRRCIYTPLDQNDTRLKDIWDNDMRQLDVINGRFARPYDFYQIIYKRDQDELSIEKLPLRESNDGIFTISSFNRNEAIGYFQSLSKDGCPLEYFKPCIKNADKINELKPELKFKICVEHNLPLCFLFKAEDFKSNIGTAWGKTYSKFFILLLDLFQKENGQDFFSSHRSYFLELDYYLSGMDMPEIWNKLKKLGGKNSTAFKTFIKNRIIN